MVVQSVARLPFPAEDGGSIPTPRLHFESVDLGATSLLLSSHHYLGPARSCRVAYAGWVDGVMVCAQVYRHPTSRMLPHDTWLELSRWCITPDAGKNAGSRMMGWAKRQLRRSYPELTTLVSYSDPVHGHLGTLYRASGWVSNPTHHSEAFHRYGGYPSGHGSWDGTHVSTPKDRWIYHL